MARIRNPDTWFAAWASSAPVQAQVDMSVYFRPIEQAMPSNCSADVHAALALVDHILTNGSERDVDNVRRAIHLLELANPTNHRPSLTDSPAVLSKLSNITSWSISQSLNYPFQHTSYNYQLHGFEAALLPFCNNLEQYSPASSRSLPKVGAVDELSLFDKWLNTPQVAVPFDAGLSATYNATVALHALLHAIFSKMQDDSQRSGNEVLPVSSRGDHMSWLWQYCSEFGFLQVSNATDSSCLISRLDNVSSRLMNTCRASFPFAPDTPNVGAINQRYGGWSMSPSNVCLSTPINAHVATLLTH